MGFVENNVVVQEFNIYPNPVSTITTFSFQLESSDKMFLTIVNLKGQVVFYQNLGQLPKGENRIEIDLSDLEGGNYHCQLTNNGTKKVIRKLVIVR